MHIKQKRSFCFITVYNDHWPGHVFAYSWLVSDFMKNSLGKLTAVSQTMSSYEWETQKKKINKLYGLHSKNPNSENSNCYRILRFMFLFRIKLLVYLYASEISFSKSAPLKISNKNGTRVACILSLFRETSSLI